MNCDAPYPIVKTLSVIHQPDFDRSNYNDLNPYAPGYAMMQDIRRICENPTREDRQYQAEIAGRD